MRQNQGDFDHTLTLNSDAFGWFYGKI